MQVVSRGHLLYFIEVAVEGGDGVESAPCGHIGYVNTFARLYGVEDAAGLGDTVFVDVVVEALALIVEELREVVSVGPDG